MCQFTSWKYLLYLFEHNFSNRLSSTKHGYANISIHLEFLERVILDSSSICSLGKAGCATPYGHMLRCQWISEFYWIWHCTNYAPNFIEEYTLTCLLDFNCSLEFSMLYGFADLGRVYIV